MAERSNAELLAIKAEITINALALSGYFPITDDTKDAANAAALNLVRPELLVDAKAVTAAKVRRCITRGDWNAATVKDGTWIDMQLAEGLIDPSPGVFRSGMVAIFGPTTATYANLVLLLTEPVNRIEQMYRNGLLLFGGTVSPSDISNARNAA